MIVASNILLGAAATFSAILSASYARNMLSTYSLVCDATNAPFIDMQHHQKTADSLISHLKQCSRRETLEIFLHASRAPTSSDLQGAWDGVLLDNNGFIMTTVSKILTHKLFGRSRLWNGKMFGVTDGQGINRFTSQEGLETFHAFEYSIEQSVLNPKLETGRLQYHKYHQRFSDLLWKSMKDEVRVIDCGDGECVVVGIGSMAWSGGMYNGSPFCLYRPKQEE